MKALFLPAIKLMNRLSYPRKYMLMGGMTSLALSILLFHLFVSMSADHPCARH